MEKQKVLVFGSGISGIGAAKLLLAVGRNVVLYDGNVNLDKQVLKEKVGGPCEVILGELSQDVMETLEFMVISPGVPTDLPIVNRIREAGIPIWSEIELAYTYGKGDVLAITGTNGKTTTTALLGEIMKNYTESDFNTETLHRFTAVLQK